MISQRPIVVVVKKPNTELTTEELLQFYEGKVAKWQIPDDIVFVDAIPLGATGKMQKSKLRENLKDYVLPSLRLPKTGITTTASSTEQTNPVAGTE
jgi:acyl-CoA synthetase (AMP-forming)/AMP-acid ligase II